MLAIIPWIIIPVIIYNAIAFSSGASEAPAIIDAFSKELFQFDLMSGATCVVTWGHLILALTLIALFIEIIKATRIANTALVDHALSMLVFIICLIEFIMVKQAGTSTFLLLTLAALIDVIAGFTIGMRSARRDFSVGDGGIGLSL